MNKSQLNIRCHEKLCLISCREGTRTGYLHRDGKIHKSTSSGDINKPLEQWAGYWKTEVEAKAFLASLPDDVPVVDMTDSRNYWPEPEEDYPDYDNKGYPDNLY